MLTSRAEYRLLLRSDNADARLTEIGHRYGLIDNARLRSVQREVETIRSTLDALATRHFSDNQSSREILTNAGLPPVSKGVSALEYVRRIDVSYDRLACALARVDPARNWEVPQEIASRIEIEARYAAYIKKELALVARASKLEGRPIPADIDYATLPSLRTEARHKLEHIRPSTLGQASRIAGVTPGDVAVLMVHLERGREPDASTALTTMPTGQDGARHADAYSADL
jgi:tRNA uridine 5-carboxymethylaminomethyl modification enzyme